MGQPGSTIRSPATDSAERSRSRTSAGCARRRRGPQGGSRPGLSCRRSQATCESSSLWNTRPATSWRWIIADSTISRAARISTERPNRVAGEPGVAPKHLPGDVEDGHQLIAMISSHCRTPLVPRLMEQLLETAASLASLGATTYHDFTGRMFQALIADRKFLATDGFPIARQQGLPIEFPESCYVPHAGEVSRWHGVAERHSPQCTA